MDLDALKCMRQGRIIKQLTASDAELLQPVTIHTGKKSGKALLCIHGFSSSPAVYRYMLPKLDYYDKISVPLLPGHSDSLQAFANATADEWLHTVEMAFYALLQEYECVDVLGLSLGGLLACHLNKYYPIHRLYLLAPALDVPQHLGPTLAMIRIARALGFHSVRSPAGNILKKDTYEIAYCRAPLHALKEVLTLIKTFRFTLPKCPCKIFLGRHDTVVDSVAVARRFFPYPGMDLHWLENSAHVLPLDNDQDYILQSMAKDYSDNDKTPLPPRKKRD